ncbi:hypothetical protein EDD85DRAFT_1028646 [Armillaria nabsnona]|nr:hypothetical protein EDD85DRAFT_1028646 [Armillaria nabsnona]
MGLTAEQSQQEQYSCDECELKYQNSTGLSNHPKFSKVHADTTNQQLESSSSSSASQGQDEPKVESTATPAIVDSTTEAPTDPLLDELISAEWNDEFIQKHFPALYAAGIRYIPEPPEMSEDFWFSLLSSSPDFSENGYESFIHSSVDFPAPVTSVDENASTTQ